MNFEQKKLKILHEISEFKKLYDNFEVVLFTPQHLIASVSMTSMESYHMIKVYSWSLTEIKEIISFNLGLRYSFCFDVEALSDEKIIIFKYKLISSTDYRNIGFNILDIKNKTHIEYPLILNYYYRLLSFDESNNLLYINNVMIDRKIICVDLNLGKFIPINDDHILFLTGSKINSPIHHFNENFYSFFIEKDIGIINIVDTKTGEIVFKINNTENYYAYDYIVVGEKYQVVALYSDHSIKFYDNGEILVEAMLNCSGNIAKNYFCLENNNLFIFTFDKKVTISVVDITPDFVGKKKSYNHQL